MDDRLWGELVARLGGAKALEESEAFRRVRLFDNGAAWLRPPNDSMTTTPPQPSVCPRLCLRCCLFCLASVPGADLRGGAWLEYRSLSRRSSWHRGRSVGFCESECHSRDGQRKFGSSSERDEFVVCSVQPGGQPVLAHRRGRLISVPCDLAESRDPWRSRLMSDGTTKTTDTRAFKIAIRES